MLQIYIHAFFSNLYGHPLTGKHRWQHLRRWLLAHGFEQCDFDPCLFKKTGHGGDRVYLIVYVDDIATFATQNSAAYAEWEREFEKEFEITNLTWFDQDKSPR